MSASRRAFLTGAAALSAAVLTPETVRAMAAMEMATDWGLATADVEADLAPTAMRLIRGRAPAELAGALYRNGPAKFRRPGRSAAHWFDGDGMVRRFRISGGRAELAARFVDTPKRRQETRLNAMVMPGFGTLGDPRAEIGGPDDVPELSGGEHPRAGLMHGSSGVALLFLHAYELDGDPAMLDLARDALAQDLRRCKRGPDGSLQVDQGWRRLPYLEEGSAGIVPVLSRYLTHRDDPELAESLAGLRSVAGARFFVQPGLFNGRAGLIAALPPDDPDLPDLVAGLRWHALTHDGGTAFPGDRLLRLSMDFATGTAGVLLALGHALSATPCFLPLMQPPGTADRKHRAAPPFDPPKGGV